MKVLAVDVGGSHVKILATGQKQKREIVSGPRMTARQMVSRVKKLSEGWAYDVVSVGFPGPVLHNRPVAEPYNLGPGWMGFDFASAFDLPVRVVNDAAESQHCRPISINVALFHAGDLNHFPHGV